MNNDWTRNSSLKQFFFVGLKRMERGRSFKKYESNQQRAIIEIYVINNILNCGQRHDREHVLRSGMNNLSSWKRTWSGIEPYPSRWPDATLYPFIELIKPTGEQAIVSLFVIVSNIPDGGNDMTWNIWNKSYFELRTKTSNLTWSSQ